MYVECACLHMQEGQKEEGKAKWERVESHTHTLMQQLHKQTILVFVVLLIKAQMSRWNLVTCPSSVFKKNKKLSTQHKQKSYLPKIRLLKNVKFCYSWLTLNNTNKKNKYTNSVLWLLCVLSLLKKQKQKTPKHYKNDCCFHQVPY